MFGTDNLLLFITTGMLLNLTPGQDTMYIVGRSIAQGRRAGILSALGISTGGIVHTIGAALGLSAILATSADLYFLIKWLGAVYLMHLGMKMFLQAPRIARKTRPLESAVSGWKVYMEGFATNLLNAKVALFFLAFLPQFVDAENANHVLPFLFLGSIFLFTGTVWCLMLAVVSSSVTMSLRLRPGVIAILNRTCGGILVGLAAKLAFATKHSR
jgi:threonine/homoserine/homoserine lactone efflux protein